MWVFENPLALWGILFILFVIAEAATTQLVSVWFAIGAFAALIASYFKASSIVQLIIFICVSVVCLLVTRPLVKKFTKGKIQSTNADRCIGQTAIVIKEINNSEASGQVKVGGNIWSAQSENGELIAEGEKVSVIKIEGVKLIVKQEKE
ncbi:MAG: NfeD family protein [Clostridia bacterium]|nr:NfeD family protein [Clostridia bacterium]